MAPNRIVAPVRREQIVHATIQCLARDGYARLTMKTLAQESGISQGLLHYYFTDKTAILAAVLAAVTAEFQRRLLQAQQDQEPSPAARLRAMVHAGLATALERPNMWRVYVQLWGEMMHNPPLHAINAALYTTLRRHLATLLTRGLCQGLFRRLDVEPAAAVIVGLIDGVALQVTFDPQAVPLPRAVACCCDAVERYLRP